MIFEWIVLQAMFLSACENLTMTYQSSSRCSTSTGIVFEHTADMEDATVGVVGCVVEFSNVFIAPARLTVRRGSSTLLDTVSCITPRGVGTVRISIPLQTVIFSDGFESGDTLNWHSQQPVSFTRAGLPARRKGSALALTAPDFNPLRIPPRPKSCAVQLFGLLPRSTNMINLPTWITYPAMREQLLTAMYANRCLRIRLKNMDPEKPCGGCQLSKVIVTRFSSERRRVPPPREDQRQKDR